MHIFGEYSRGPMWSSTLIQTEPALVCARRSVAGAVSRLIVCTVSFQTWLSCCAVHIVVVNRGDVFKHNFTTQVTHCNCVLYPCVVSTHSRDLQIETCRPRGPKWNLIPTLWCPVPSRCTAGGPIIKIKSKIMAAPFKARHGYVYDILFFILSTWYSFVTHTRSICYWPEVF